MNGDWMMGGQLQQQGFRSGPTEPDTFEAIRSRTELRIAYLKAKLEEVEGWRDELNRLYKMLDAVRPTTST
jgi:hypothetical protein